MIIKWIFKGNTLRKKTNRLLIVLIVLGVLLISSFDFIYKYLFNI